MRVRLCYSSSTLVTDEDSRRGLVRIQAYGNEIHFHLARLGTGDAKLYDNAKFESTNPKIVSLQADS